MAYINKEVSTMAMPSGMNRMGQFPLDMSSVWYSMEELTNYATSGAIAYVGQIVSLVDETNNKVVVYSIQNKAGDLKEVGVIPLGGDAVTVDENGRISVNVDNTTIKIADNKLTAIIPEVEIPEYEGDNKSIEINDLKVSMHDFGKAFYKYIPEVKDEEGNTTAEARYERVEVSETNLWKAGLEPKVVTENGELVIGWFEPNPTTIEGVNDQVTAVQGTVADLETSVGVPSAEGQEATGLYKEVEDVQADVVEVAEDVKELADEVGTKEDTLGDSVQTVWAHVNNHETRIETIENTFVSDTDLETFHETISAEIDADVKVEKDRAEAAEKALGERIDAIDFVDEDEMAEAIEAALVPVNEAIGTKAAQSEFEALKGRVEAFLDNTGAATEAIDTLQDLINYISTHDDVEISDIIADIQALQTKVDTGDQKVSEYVTAAIDALKIGDYAKAADLTELAGRVEALEAKPFDTYATKSEVETVDAKFASYTNTEALEALLAEKQDVIADGTYVTPEGLEGSLTSIRESINALPDSIIHTAEGMFVSQGEFNNAQTSLSGRIDTLEKYDHSIYATNEALNTHTQNAEAALAKKIETGTIAHSTEELAEGVTVNGTEMNIVVDAFTKAETRQYVADTIKTMTGGESAADVKLLLENHVADYTEKVGQIDAKDAAQDTAIAAAQAQADKGVADAATAAQAAATAQAKADSNANSISALETAKEEQAQAILNLQSEDTSAKSRLDALETTVNNTESGVAANHAAVVKNAADIATLIAKDGTHDTDIANLKTSTANNGAAITQLQTDIANVYTKTEADGKFVVKEDGKSLISNSEIERLANVHNYDDSAVRSLISNIYVAANGDTAASGVLATEIARVEGLISAEATRADLAEKANANEIIKINALLETVSDTDNFTSLKELALWVEEHGEAASEMAEGIQANATAIEAINSAENGILVQAKAYSDANLATAKGYTDSSIAALQASIHGVDDNTIKLSDNKAYVAKVSTDILEQGSMELVLCSGDAVGYHTTH